MRPSHLGPNLWRAAGRRSRRLSFAELLAHPFLANGRQRHWPDHHHRGRRAANSVSRKTEGRGRRVMDPALDALARAASAPRAQAGTPLRIRGGGTKDFYGGALAGDVRRHPASTPASSITSRTRARHHGARRNVAFPAIESAMRARGQMLGVRAAALRPGGHARRHRRRQSGLSVPAPALRRRRAATSCSACSVLDGAGRAPDVRRAGHEERGGLRRVAPHERARSARSGSSPKCRSNASRCWRTETTVVFECAADEAIRRANEWGGQPLPLSATCFHDGQPDPCGCRGAQPAVPGRDGEDRRGQLLRRRGRLLEQPCAITPTRSSRPPSKDDKPLWRLSVRSAAPYTDLGGDQLIEWGGALRWLAATERACRPGQRSACGPPRRAGTRRCFAVPSRQPTRSIPWIKRSPRSIARSRRCSIRRACSIAAALDSLMQTDLAPEYRDTHDGREADTILRSCVHCGFCTATCPTYQLLGDELDGLRGRIYLIKQVLEGAAVTEKTQLHLDRCLTCRSCETTCPSGVQYGRLIDIGRRLVDAKVGRSPADGAQRWMLRRTLPVEALVQRGAHDGAPGQGPAAARARRSHSRRPESRRRVARAAPRPQDADPGGLRAAGAQAQHRRRGARVLDRIGITPMPRAGRRLLRRAAASPDREDEAQTIVRKHRRVVAAACIAEWRRSSSRPPPAV